MKETASTLTIGNKHSPEDIRQSIYTTNSIERTVKEIRKRLYPMNSIPNVQAAEKIVYLVVHEYNERWANRINRGFGMEILPSLDVFDDGVGDVADCCWRVVRTEKAA